MKSVRFSQVVKACGQPHVHTLWLAPEKDPEIKRARQEHRVMTVQSLAGKADSGTVGFESTPKPNAEVLIFPKSLKRFEDARIVGIKFDLVAQPKRKSVPPQAWSNVPARQIPVAAREKPASKPVEFPPSVQASPAGPAANAARPARPPRREQDHSLRREVRAALKELEQGKAVSAYQRLTQALAVNDPHG